MVIDIRFAYHFVDSDLEVQTFSEKDRATV